MTRLEDATTEKLLVEILRRSEVSVSHDNSPYLVHNILKLRAGDVAEIIIQQDTYYRITGTGD